MTAPSSPLDPPPHSHVKHALSPSPRPISSRLFPPHHLLLPHPLPLLSCLTHSRSHTHTLIHTCRYIAAVRSAGELRDALAGAESEAAAARVGHQELELRAATLRRRVDRARQGGRQVATEAEAMYEELCGAREWGPRGGGGS